MQETFNSKLYKNSFYLIGGTVITGAVNFFFWLIAARLYSPEVVGITSALITSSLLLVALFDLGFATAIVFYASRYQEAALRYIHPIFRAGWFISLFAALLFILGIPYWATGLSTIRQELGLVLIFVLLTLSNYLLGLQDAVMLSKKDASFVFWRNAASNVPSFLLLLLLSTGARSMVVPLLAFSIPNILVNLIAGFSILPKKFHGFHLWGSFNPEIIQQVSRYSLSNYSANLIWGASNYILPLVAVNFLSNPEVAYFYITWSIFNFVLVIPRGVSSSLFVEKVDQPEHISKAVSRSLYLIFSLTLPLILFLYVFGPYIMNLLGNNYVQTEALLLLLLSSIPFTINGIYFMVKRIKREVVTLNLFSISLTILIITLAVYFSRQYGIRGLALGWLASQLICALFVVALTVFKSSMRMLHLRVNPSE